MKRRYSNLRTITEVGRPTGVGGNCDDPGEVCFLPSRLKLLCVGFAKL